MILRPHQSLAIEQLYTWMRENDGNPLVDACVSAGKSVMLAALCQDAIKQWPDTRIIMLVPSKELLEQNLEKLIAVWPDAPIGILSASVGKRQIGNAITIATIGSIYRRAHELGQVHLMLVDEAHLIRNSDAGMYRAFIASLKKYCPDLRVAGFTGSPFRGDGVWLTAGEDPLFHDIAARVTMDDLLAAGYLTPLTTQPTVTRMDAAGVKMVGGDYVVSDLARAIDRPELVAAACAETVRLAADRKAWLVYCVTVAHAVHVTEEFQRLGITCALVTGETPKAERAQRIADFRAGRLRALISVAVLTTGFSVEAVDCIVLLRNTASPVLYVQILGRAMRTHPGKTDALVLDFTDTIERLGPVNKVKGRLPKKTKGEAPVKVCEECGSLNPISAKECKTCGTEFPIEETQPHSVSASNAQVLDLGKPHIVEYTISRVTYGLHTKPGKPDSLKVSYWSGIRRICDEWICLSHEGFARSKAEAWWLKRAPGGRTFLPGGTEQAIEWLTTGYKLAEPVLIRVNESSKYPEIVGYVWAQETPLIEETA